jgi:hypothetical protein
MDSSIPIGRRWAIGLDGLLGLVPGVGDLIGAAVSAVVLAAAVRSGIPRAALARMAVNVALDALLGAIPVAGDVFDFAHKANTKNLRIFREALAGAREPVRDWGFVVAVAVGLTALLLLPVLGLFLLIRALF